MTRKKVNLHNNIKGIIFTVAAILLMGLLFVSVIKSVSSSSKTPADYSKVWKILEENGFLVYDTTQNQLDKNSDSGITREISAQKDDIYFAFHILKNSSVASEAYSQYYWQIHDKELNPGGGNSSSVSNWMIYSSTITNDEKHYVVTVVGNTAAFVSGNEEHRNEIHHLLEQIGYPSFNQSKESDNPFIMALIYLAMIIVVALPLTRMAWSWLWKYICRIGLPGLPTEDRPVFSFKSYRFFLENSDNKKWKLPMLIYALCFLPTAISLISIIFTFFPNVKLPNPTYFLFAVIIIDVIGVLVKPVFIKGKR